MSLRPSPANKHLEQRHQTNSLSSIIFLVASMVGILVLMLLLFDILQKGLPWLDWEFLVSFPSRHPDKAGIVVGIIGSLWVVILTILFAFPIGVGTAIYLEEYAPDNALTRFFQTNISNLAGVPSIVYGLLGLTVFVRMMALGRSIAAAGLTMALLILPVIIIAAQEALRAVPESLRHASLALGSTKWQTVRNVVLPAAFPGILTGAIIAVSRAVGETAPLVAIGAWGFIRYLPLHPMDGFTAMPIQIYLWTTLPQEEFHYVAAAGIIVLLVFLLGLNASAIILRDRYEQKFRT